MQVATPPINLRNARSRKLSRFRLIPKHLTDPGPENNLRPCPPRDELAGYRDLNSSQKHHR